MRFHRKVYNTLTNVTDPLAQVEVDALAFSVQCGEVPEKNYTINMKSIFGGFHVAVTADVEGRTLGFYFSPLAFAFCDFLKLLYYRYIRKFRLRN
jgi:hypothetical protein